ncbi:apolipoprotein N-acyltransferase [Marinomonas sp. C2222]|uniref:Apolipoprotein N-acyltransferase n=1 Tax=Marinomonas sargassi TaxID=2984494 RepID=A0ABT2YRE6_9GAMM|nr:apolipoprotein N-acyltransferase [Marinomonas sargassi]MCV2402441.1 apolipoprotein N-acyltransferase [Marinomonas sargassi]
MSHSSPNATLNALGQESSLLLLIQKLPSPLIYCLGLASGAIGVTSFSPFNFGPNYFFSLFIFSLFIMTSPSAKAAFWRGLSVALGFFGAGVSWVYVSIAEYGQVSSFIACAITFAFVALLSLFWGCSAWLAWLSSKKLPLLPRGLIISLFLLLAEFARSTLFTGFPWLLPGYATENTWLFELLPIGGIWLNSAIVVLTACSVAELFLSIHNLSTRHLRQGITENKAFTFVILPIWCLSAVLSYLPISWVEQTGSLKTTLVQGNVKQDEKWLADMARESLSYYQQATMNHLNSDLVVWPETAITYLYPQIKPYLAPFSKELSESDTTLITGIPDLSEDKTQYYNAILATGNGFGLYYKQRLVPFGEYIPLSDLLGPILDLFQMPISAFKSGEKNQPVLQVGEWGIAPFICYEIVYAEQVRSMVRDSDVLITISNDAWFGSSIGPWQHLQIAQFRAKEAGRYVIRSTNTGLTAIINERGEITDQAPQFQRTTLTANVKTFAGITPYVQWGYLPTISLIFLCLVASLRWNRRSKKDI